jgi:hypothetical protein
MAAPMHQQRPAQAPFARPMTRHHNPPVRAPFSRPPAKLNVIVWWLVLAAMWAMLMLSWLIIGFDDTGEDYDAAAHVVSVRELT